MTEATERQSSAWRRFWRGVWLFILWLIRLIVAIGAGILLGAAIFYVAYVGVPQFYAQVLNPIQVNSAKVDILQSDMESTRTSMNEDLRTARDEIRTLRTTVSEQMAAIDALSAELEAERANRNELLAVLQDDVREIDETVQFQTVALAELEGDVDEVAEEVTLTSTQVTEASTARDAQLEALAADVATLEEQNEMVVAEVTDLEQGLETARSEIATNEEAMTAAVETLQQDVSDFGTQLQAVDTEIEAINAVITMPVTMGEAFSRRLVLMQAWQEILKARLHLLEQNTGYATESLHLAMNNVDRFLALSPDLSGEAVTRVQNRMETVAGAVEDEPYTAVQELEIVWRTLGSLISRPIIAEEAVGQSAAVEETQEAAPAEEAAGEGESTEETTTEETTEAGTGETEGETTDDEGTTSSEGDSSG
jgi:chromosome segregation ATPase